MTAQAEPDGCGLTAAASNGWGPPNMTSDFSDSTPSGWNVYSGPGHNGNGRRTPAAVSTSGGILTISADGAGNSGGMGWQSGQLHGRWEVCARSTAGAATYHPVLLLWPDAEDFPVGGEIDFMEITDPARQFVEGWLHYGPDDRREGSVVAIDATQWHSWAVEWTPEAIVYFVDGRPWWRTTNTAHFPPRPMHLCIQLDNFGGDSSQGGQLMVDWARQYPA
ncbi:glycoside hydrolase family 16 protein [Mycobacterium sp. PS03-16]|uniref:glycoside hydrolase family 16 protein n=1 Tax=Mycobacterium sp. PS03-16 TaxID=2559611 RepID=UPI001FD7F6EB|nr:glycoside hydrolase family 16 protein [Mycobacterium sp. PS03-16]